MKGKKLYKSPDLTLGMFDSECILSSASIDTGGNGGALNEVGFGNTWLG